MTTGVGAPVTREGARAAAEHELSKPIYHRYDDPWPVRLYRWVSHEVGRLFDTVGSHAPGGGAGAVALVVLVLLVLVVLRWRLGPVQRSRQVRRVFVDTAPTTAARHRQAAGAAAAAADWSTAVVERTRGLARELEERGVVDPRPGRTADELAAEVAAELPAAAMAVRAAVATFDAVAYGGHEATRASYDVVADADTAVCRGRLTAATRG